MKMSMYIRIGRRVFRHAGVFIALVWAASAAAANLFVVPFGTHDVQPGWDYTSWATAATNIQTAIDAADGGNIVYVSNGTYTLSEELNLAKGVVLRSWNNGTTDREGTIIDGGYYDGCANTNRCLKVNHAQAVVDGFTIQNGMAFGSWDGGGGVYLNTGGTLTNCVVVSNQAYSVSGDARGGGVFVNSSDSIITHCDIIANTAFSYGGGINVHANAAGLISHCLMESNSVSSSTTHNGGGGFSVFASSMSVRNCVIRRNTVAANGGGAVLFNCGAVIENCEFIDNYQFSTSDGRDGAGICLIGAGTVRNCLIVGNTNFSFYKAAIQIYGIINTTGVVENCTISDNSRGVNFYPIVGQGVIRNSIVYNNIRSDHDGNSNVVFVSSCTTPLPEYGSDNIADDPLFAGTNYFLTGASPCIDAGVNQPWMETAVDLAGRRRIDGFGRIVDMGCYEYLPSGSVFYFR